MKITLRAPIVLRFHSPLAREAVFLLVAGLRSALVAGFVFVGFVYPLSYLQWLKAPLVLTAKVLAVPIYLLGRVIPSLASPVLDGHPEFASLGQIFRVHMVIGILAYLILFHIPLLIRVLRNRAAGRAGAHA